jgi:hypothetical protein
MHRALKRGNILHDVLALYDPITCQWVRSDMRQKLLGILTRNEIFDVLLCFWTRISAYEFRLGYDSVVFWMIS